MFSSLKVTSFCLIASAMFAVSSSPAWALKLRPVSGKPVSGKVTKLPTLAQANTADRVPLVSSNPKPAKPPVKGDITLQYLTKQWRSRTFQGAGPAVDFQNSMKRMGFETSLNAGSSFHEYKVYYRTLVPLFEKFNGQDPDYRAGLWLQYMVGLQVDVKVIRH